MPGSACCSAGVDATITESPTAVTDPPETCRVASSGLGDPDGFGDPGARSDGGFGRCDARWAGRGAASFACRDPPSDAACAPPSDADAEANSCRLPARQSPIATAMTPPRMAAARRLDLLFARVARGFLCFGIGKRRAEIRCWAQDIGSSHYPA